MATYGNSHAQFDCAIDGVPFFLGPTSEFPLVRQAVESQRQQVDMSREPGEQSLTSWWYRSQSSFHLGAGLRFYDPVRGSAAAQFRFWDSAGVDVWTPGKVRLLRSMGRKYEMESWGSIASYFFNGDHGVLVEHGTDLKRVLSSGSTSTVNYRAGSATIKALDTSGSYYFVADNDGVWRGKLNFSGTATKVYSFPGSIDRANVAWAKERLFVAANASLYELVATPGSPPRALPDDYEGEAWGRLLITHPEEDWRWRSIAPGPDCVFFAGYAGDFGGEINGTLSAVYASTIEVANIDDAPQVTQPSVVAELPRGEYVTRMVSYAGVFLILGTTRGVRVCLIGEGGSLRVGPLSVESDASVQGLAVWDHFVWAAGADVAGKWGAYRIDLSAPLDDSGLLFAWAKDVASGQNSNSGNASVMAMLGKTGRVCLMVNGSGLWIEDASERVEQGWLQTGVLRMDTWEDKIFQYLRTVFDPDTAGSVQPEWLPESGSLAALSPPEPVSGVSRLDTLGSDLQPRMGLSYRFYLRRDEGDATLGPAMLGYQAKVTPSNVKQRTIRLPLLCYRRERKAGGRTVERPVWDRVLAMEALERVGSVVPYQDFMTGESMDVIVDSVQFTTDRPSQSRADAENPGGMLLVTLKTTGVGASGGGGGGDPE